MKAICGGIVAVIGVLWTVVAVLGSIEAAHEAGGVLGTVAGVLLLPLCMLWAPLYTGIHDHHWGFALWVFGGAVVLSTLGAVKR